MRQYHVEEIAKGVMKIEAQHSSKVLNQFPALQDDDVKYIIAYGHALTMGECYEIQGRKPPSLTHPADKFKYAQSIRLHRQMRLKARAAVIDHLMTDFPVPYVLLDMLQDPNVDPKYLQEALLNELSS